jgi:hypothetical protein
MQSWLDLLFKMTFCQAGTLLNEMYSLLGFLVIVVIIIATVYSVAANAAVMVYMTV